MWHAVGGRTGDTPPHLGFPTWPPFEWMDEELRPSRALRWGNGMEARWECDLFYLVQLHVFIQPIVSQCHRIKTRLPPIHIPRTLFTISERECNVDSLPHSLLALPCPHGAL